MDHRQAMDMDHRQALKAGTILDGKYRIERLIGSGGFGITYQAYDLGLAATVAIKEYFPSQFGIRDATHSVRPRVEGDRDMFERLRSSFLREARTLNQFDHFAIVRVFNVFEAYGTAYMVMKFESGPSLKSWLADLGRLPSQSELDRLTAPLLDALEMMHAAAFLHRDIAPDNIIVRADGTPVLLDFGASRRVMGEMTGTLTGVVKKGYSPQEQYAMDGRSQGPWTDIYALGATLYRCVSNETPDEATQRMLDDNVLPAVEVGADSYRPTFLAAIDAAIVLRPRDRPQSIAAWREMLFDGVVVTAGHPRSLPAPAAVGAPRPDDIAIAHEPTHISRPHRSERRTGDAVPTPRSAAPLMESPSAGSGLKKVAVAAGLVALVSGGALLAGWDRVDLRGTPAQVLIDVFSESPKTDETSRREADEARQRHDQQIVQLTREAELRAAEELRQRRIAEEAEATRKAEEAREHAAAEARRVADEARRVAEEETRRRQLAEAAGARRISETDQKRAIEEAHKRDAETARQRKLADEAEARRQAAEQAQRRQEDEVRRATREAAERASETTRRQIEEETRPRSLAEDTTQLRNDELAELRRKFVDSSQRPDDASRSRAAEEARLRAVAEANTKAAKDRTKIAALAKPPTPAPTRLSFDGGWSISYTALSPQCYSGGGQFLITISNFRITTKRGTSGPISATGSARWSMPSLVGSRLVDYIGSFRASSGSGTYATRGGRCHGRFSARRI